MLNIFSATVVFLRIFAAYLAIDAALTSAAFFAFVMSPAAPDKVYKTYTSVAATGSVALFLVAFLVAVWSKKIAYFITRDLQDDLIEVNDETYATLQSIGLSLLGAYILLHSIPLVVRILAAYAFPAPTTTEDVLITPTGYKTTVPLPYILQNVTQLGLGIWLLLGAKRIASLLKKGWAKGRDLGN